MADTENITVLSLCKGYGGIELGLSRTLARTLRVVAVEIEAYALANLVAKTEESKLAIEALWPDVRTFPAEKFRGCFDIVTSGDPCQPDSIALESRRLHDKDPCYLWPIVRRIIEAVEPVCVFRENVEGHVESGFKGVCRDLENMGYEVEAGLFSAAGCGANHLRKRIFAYACKKGLEGHVKSLLAVKPEETHDYAAGQNWWDAEPAVCRMDDGTPNRVDRLRLLGNGVVPQCAEKAFRELIKNFDPACNRDRR